MHILQLCWDALLLLDKLNFKMSPNLFAMVLCVGDRSYVAQRQRSDAEDNGRPKKRIKMASVVTGWLRTRQQKHDGGEKQKPQRDWYTMCCFV